MVTAADRALKYAQAEGLLNQQNIDRQSPEQEMRKNRAQQASLNLVSNNEPGALIIMISIHNIILFLFIFSIHK